jgi:predicted amidohydrolase
MKKKISLIQMDIAFSNNEENFKNVTNLIEKASKDKPDIICLPEMWNVGFFPKEKLTELSDNNGETTKKLLSSLAKKYDVNIIGGSVANRKEDKIYNTAFVFNRLGECIAEYDKIHGFSPSGEHEYFVGGSKLCTFEIDGIRSGIIICYDIRFGELARSLALTNIDLLFIPAAWPHPRLHHWKTLAMARAIENQMFVAAINGCGKSDSLSFCGNSMIIDPWGEVLNCGDESQCIVTGEMDFSVVENIRNNINVFKDRKPEIYKL